MDLVILRDPNLKLSGAIENHEFISSRQLESQEQKEDDTSIQILVTGTVQAIDRDFLSFSFIPSIPQLSKISLIVPKRDQIIKLGSRVDSMSIGLNLNSMNNTSVGFVSKYVRAA